MIILVVTTLALSFLATSSINDGHLPLMARERRETTATSNEKNNKHLMLVIDEPWEDGPQAPLPVYSHSSFLVDDLVFLVGGFGDTVYKTRRDVQVWNMKLYKWLPLGTFKPLPEKAAETHQAVASGDGFLFLASGQVNEGCSDDSTTDSWALHVATDTLMRLPQVPQKRYAANGAYFLGELHIVGGAIEDREAASSKHWMLPFGKALAAARWPLAEEPLTTHDSGHQYKQSTSVSKADLERLQRELDSLSWQADTEFPMNIVHSGSIVVGNSWYRVSGDQAHEAHSENHQCLYPNRTPSTKALYKYDFVCDDESTAGTLKGSGRTSLSTTANNVNRCRQWTRLADLPKAISHIEPSIVHFEGFLVVVGGSRELNYLVPFVQAYSIADDTWSIIHEFKNGGIKSATCWLQNCTTTSVEGERRKQCRLFAAAGEPGKPISLEPDPPSTNRVFHTKLRFVDIGWPETMVPWNSHLVPVSGNLFSESSTSVLQEHHSHVMKYALKQMDQNKREDAMGPLVVNLERVGLPVKVSVWKMDAGSSDAVMLGPATEGNGIIDNKMLVTMLYTLSGTARIRLTDGDSHILQPGSVAFVGVQHQPLVHAETHWMALQVAVTLQTSELQKLKVAKKISSPRDAYNPFRHDPVMRDLLQGNVIPSVEGFFHVEMDGGWSPTRTAPSSTTTGGGGGDGKHEKGKWSVVFGISGQLDLSWDDHNTNAINTNTTTVHTSVSAGELVFVPRALASLSWAHSKRPSSSSWAALAMELSRSPTTK